MKYKTFILILLAVTIFSCSSEKQGLKELKRLCEKDAGLTIYKTVEADGYFDATGGFDLVLSPYKFYEFCDDSPSPSKFNVIPEPGCYRVEKVQRETGQCHQGYDEALAKVVVEPYPEFLKENCIAVEKIEKPTAKYRYEVGIKEWWLDESAGTKMTSYTGKVTSNETEEIIGVTKNYILRPKKYNTPPTINCGSYHITGLQKSMPFAAGLIEKTLLPRENQQIGEFK